MNEFDTEMKKLVDFVFDVCKDKVKGVDKEWVDYTFFGYNSYLSISDEAEGDYYVNVDPYNDGIHCNIHINSDRTYYIFENYPRLDGDEDVIRDILIKRYGEEVYKEKLKSLL